MSTHGNAWCRRQAHQIVAQLPEEGSEALAILNHAIKLVELDMATPNETYPQVSETAQERPVVAFRRGGGTSPSNSAICTLSPSRLLK